MVPRATNLHVLLYGMMMLSNFKCLTRVIYRVVTRFESQICKLILVIQSTSEALECDDVHMP